MKLHLWKPLCYCGLPRTLLQVCSSVFHTSCFSGTTGSEQYWVYSTASCFPSFLPLDMKIMGIKGSWLWLGGFSGCAGPQPITLGRLLCFHAAPALAHTCGSGQGWSCRLAQGGFGSTSERNTQLPRRAAGLGMRLPWGQGPGQCSVVMLGVSASSPQCCGKTWGHSGGLRHLFA